MNMLNLQLLLRKPFCFRSWIIFKSLSNFSYTLTLETCKKSKKKNTAYIIDREVALSIVEFLSADLSNGDIVVIPNPLPGHLLDCVLNKTENGIVIYDIESEALKMTVPTLISNHRVNVAPYDFYKFFHYLLIEKKTGSNIHSDFLSALKLNEKNKSKTYVVGTVTDTKFINRLLLCFVYQCSIYEFLYPIFYIYVPYRLLSRLILSQFSIRYMKTTLPIHFYFNVDILTNASIYSFHPVSSLAFKKNKQENFNYYLVKISPNFEFFKLVPQNELINFNFFIRGLTVSTGKGSLIDLVERWIPGSGPDFIKFGFDPFIQPKDLSPKQLLEAYRVFTTQPSYTESMFHHYKQLWESELFQVHDEIKN